jgi:DNA-directed RNA polymerase specialized sigma24 family protein
VIESDTVLAIAMQDGDFDGLVRLIERYGATVTSVATQLTGDTLRGHQIAHDVFVRAWQGRDEFQPGSDFAPWLASLTARLASNAPAPPGVEVAEGVAAVEGVQGADGVEGVELSDEDLDRAWAVASATASVPHDRRHGLRKAYVDGIVSDERAPEIARDQLKIERRLSHLAATEVAAALANPGSWTELDPALAARVIASVEPIERGGPPIDPHGRLASAVERRGDIQPAAAATVERRRSVRSALIGFGAAFGLLFGVIALLSAFSGRPQRASLSIELVPTGVVAEVDGGTVDVTERDAGLELKLDAPTLPRRPLGSYYEGVLILDDGEEVSIGTFSAGSDVTLWGGVPLERVNAIRVVLGKIGSVRSPVETSTDVVLKADIPR